MTENRLFLTFRMVNRRDSRRSGSLPKKHVFVKKNRREIVKTCLLLSNCVISNPLEQKKDISCFSKSAQNLTFKANLCFTEKDILKKRFTRWIRYRFFAIAIPLNKSFLQLDFAFLPYLLSILTCVRMWMCVDEDDNIMCGCGYGCGCACCCCRVMNVLSFNVSFSCFSAIYHCGCQDT